MKRSIRTIRHELHQLSSMQTSQLIFLRISQHSERTSRRIGRRRPARILKNRSIPKSRKECKSHGKNRQVTRVSNSEGLIQAKAWLQIKCNSRWSRRQKAEDYQQHTGPGTEDSVYNNKKVSNQSLQRVNSLPISSKRSSPIHKAFIRKVRAASKTSWATKSILNQWILKVPL